MEEKHRHKSRERHNYTLRFNSFLNMFPPFLGKLSTLMILLPAFFYSCGNAAEDLMPRPPARAPEIRHPSGIRTMDIFVFKNDRARTLDCYQRIDDMELWDGTVVSGSGDMTITILANTPYGRNDWLRMGTHSYLKDVILNLEDERKESLFMAGEITAESHKSRIAGKKDLPLEPFACEILLNSISCDFSGRPYAGEKLSDVRAYLTNVNAECRILDDDSAAPTRIINAGRLHEEDLEKFAQPDIIMQEIPGEIGPDPVNPDIRLLCYSNCSSKETPGTPYTRLVIEGKVSGSTYYWPVSINRGTGDEEGVRRNRRYVYDIRITRKGTSDPDIPALTEDIIINQKVTEWKGMEEYEVSF